MKTVVKRAVSALGLEQPARQVLLELKARGWRPWEPLVPENAFRECVSGAIAKLHEVAPTEPFGDYLEFGVSRGTSTACVYHCLRDAGLQQARLIGFDSFAGLPPEAATEGWTPGDFRSTIEATRSYLKSQQVDLDRVRLVKGWFKDTLTDQTRQTLAIGKASLIMLDCDIYSASKKALDFCEPHIHRHAVIMFDDWGWREDEGEIGQKEVFCGVFGGSS
jgi:O-methyltransferase